MNVILQPMISTNTITHSSWETTNIYVYKAEHYSTAYDQMVKEQGNMSDSFQKNVKLGYYYYEQNILLLIQIFINIALKLWYIRQFLLGFTYLYMFNKQCRKGLRKLMMLLSAKRKHTLLQHALMYITKLLQNL